MKEYIEFEEGFGIKVQTFGQLNEVMYYMPVLDHIGITGWQNTEEEARQILRTQFNVNC